MDSRRLKLGMAGKYKAIPMLKSIKCTKVALRSRRIEIMSSKVRTRSTRKGGYSWVKEEVLRLRSLLLDQESVTQLGSSSMWVREGSEARIEFLSCSREDMICHVCDGSFHVYTCVFVELGVRFPFTELECAVLRQLNCAPSQIHPNNWGFIRGFEVLMQFLGEELLIGLPKVGLHTDQIGSDMMSAFLTFGSDLTVDISVGCGSDCGYISN
ncbi:hypothetical protein PIB30_010173 [Stylosanthes scabra]|uniref:Uncharacterized protein n=1 Tax=Stylosanthes scabra TaxID=79078 RepID=A0ABU6Q6H9_9FABA|nr:hypothetical protein [Stylosanthes scabra]